ncbi:hypothetical protein [Halocella sp. SP3-1]|uniref:hypothetical protein n=1 Tax=Halocella sp. SP3-1 TaxID=2382161 RepID=UPI000F7D6157|nr:hypothetical protein [Halocella sp. SP3-1]
MKKILVSLMVFSMIMLALSSSSFAANMLGKTAFKQWAMHKNVLVNSVNVSSYRTNEVILTLQENNEKSEDAQAELKSALSDLEELYVQRENMVADNMFSSEIDKQINNLETIVDNYYEYLSYLGSKRSEELENFLTAGQYTKLKNIVNSHRIFVKLRG